MDVSASVVLIWLALCLILRTACARRCACATENVNILDGPDTMYLRKGLLRPPTCLTYRKTVGKWANVEFNSKDAWVYLKFVRIADCSDSSLCAFANNNVKIRNGAGVRNRRIGILFRGQRLPFKGDQIQSGGYTWTHVNFKGQDGFIAAKWLSIKACKAPKGLLLGQLKPCDDPTPAGCPHIIHRLDWGARAPKKVARMSLRPQNVFIHHCTGSCNSVATCKKVVRGYQNYFMDTMRFYDIGYSFIVAPNGNVYEGRGWMVTGDHTKGHNDGYDGTHIPIIAQTIAPGDLMNREGYHSIHVITNTLSETSMSNGFCVIGDFAEKTPTLAALKALRRLIRCGIDNGLLRRDYILQAHRDVAMTSCPGDAFYKLIKTWPHYKNSKC